MAGYCLKDGRLQEKFEGDTAGLEPAAIFRLTQGGELTEPEEIPVLEAGEGLLMYAGDFYIDPLEVQIEFLKAVDARKWLEALVLRHMDRIRQITDGLWVVAEIKEVET